MLYSTEYLLDARTRKRDTTDSGTASHVSTVDLNNIIEEMSSSKVDIMRFLLPPLCHLSADEKMRKILIDNQGLALLSKYFFQQWKVWNGSAKNDVELCESETCLVTLLGIFLNFVVTEDKLTVSSEFREIGWHAVTSVPLLFSSKTNVVIQFNLVLLGLLFLRSHVKHNITFNTEELSKFLKTSICILKEARPVHEDQCIEHSTTQMAARCKEVWTDIAELWFLGLQVVSVLSSSLPVMRELLKESGWIEGIVTHLNTNSFNQELSKDEKDALLDLARKVNDMKC